MSLGFPSWRSYRHFEHAVRWHTRFIHEPQVLEFLDAVSETAEKGILRLRKGSEVWRAQLGAASVTVSEEDPATGEHVAVQRPAPFPPERMIPLPQKASEGRVNPKGIPYLYLATDPETAMAETRPWVHALISLGRFEVARDVRLVDCGTHRSRTLYVPLEVGEVCSSPVYQEPMPSEREAIVWQDINWAFSRPVTPSDDHADYVPTQVLADLFKYLGYDGVAYNSSCANGKNLALFRLEDATLRDCHLYRVSTLQYAFEEVDRAVAEK